MRVDWRLPGALVIVIGLAIWDIFWGSSFARNVSYLLLFPWVWICWRFFKTWRSGKLTPVRKAVLALFVVLSLLDGVVFWGNELFDCALALPYLISAAVIWRSLTRGSSFLSALLKGWCTISGLKLAFVWLEFCAILSGSGFAVLFYAASMVIVVPETLVLMRYLHAFSESPDVSWTLAYSAYILLFNFGTTAVLAALIALLRRARELWT